MPNKKIQYYLIALLLIGLGFVYYRFNPSEGSYFLKCPFKTITGWDCPGCGSQRAVHALLHLNFREAWRYNPLVMLLIPYALMALLLSVDSVKSKYPKWRKIWFGETTIVLLLIAVLAFFVMRNF